MRASIRLRADLGYSKFSLFQFDDADVFAYAAYLCLWESSSTIGNMLRGRQPV